MKVNIDLDTKQVIKTFSIAVLFVVGVAALIKLSASLILVLISFFIALALNPAVSLVARIMPGKRRGPAVALVFVTTIALLVFLLASIVPPVAKESSRFVASLPKTINSSLDDDSSIGRLINRYKLQDNIDTLADLGKNRITAIGQNALGGLGRVGGSIFNSISVLVIAVLMLTGGGKLLGSMADALYRDQKLRQRHEKLAAKMYTAVTGYALGQVSMALVASLAALGVLLLLGVPYPLPLAALVFVFGLIPLIGNTLAAILIVLMTLVLDGVSSGLILLVFFVIYQQVENMTLQPIVQGKTSDLPPLVIFISVILGVGLMGPLGGLFAIPAAGCVKVLANDWLEHRTKHQPEAATQRLATKLTSKLKRSKPA